MLLLRLKTKTHKLELTGVDSMGGISVRLLGSMLPLVDERLAANELEMPSNFSNTPARSDGAATNGVSLGALLRSDLKAWSRLNNSEDGTGEMVAKEEWMPLGGFLTAKEDDP
jgi:hypothetical protein